MWRVRNLSGTESGAESLVLLRQFRSYCRWLVFFPCFRNGQADVADLVGVRSARACCLPVKCPVKKVKKNRVDNFFRSCCRKINIDVERLKPLKMR